MTTALALWTLLASAPVVWAAIDYHAFTREERRAAAAPANDNRRPA